MLNDLTLQQRALASYMSHISQQAWGAGWMQGLEVALWRAVIDGPYKFGQLQLEEAHIQQLRALTNACGGWIYFDGKSEETFILLADWIAKVKVEYCSKSSIEK